MSDPNLKLALEIALQTSNLKDLASLTQELKALGVDVSELSEKSEHLNDTFNTLETKQGLIDLFRAQKLAVVEASTAWQDAQDNTKNLAQEWQAAAATADELKVAMEASDEVTREQKAEYNAAAKEVENYAKAHAKSAAEAAKLKDEHTSLNTELSATRQAMADTGLSTTDLAGQSAELREQSAAATEALAELNAEAESLSEIAKAKIVLGIETDDAALAQLEEVNQAYELLRDSGTLSSAELAAATEAHTERVQELEDSLSGATEEATDFATELGKVTAAAGGLAVVAQAAMDFESAMAGVKKTVDGSPEQIQALSSEIKQLSIDLGLSSEAVADIAAQGGQLGIPVEELGAFTEMAGKMSVAFGISAEEAAEAAAKLANVFGLSMIDVEALGDAINTLGNNTAAKEPEIVEAMLRIGGTAKQFGLAEEQAAALATAFIALGKTPEVAGTAINSLLTKLQTAGVQGKDFQEALAGIGLSGDKLAADISANPQQALSGFLQTLSQLDSQQRAITTFKLFGQEYADDVNLLVSGLDGYNAALALTEDKSKTAGAMQTEFEAAMSTSAAQVDRAEAAIMALTQTLGTHLLPIISATVSGAVGAASAVNSFAETFPMITQLVVMVAGAKVAMVALKSATALAGAVGLTAGIDMSNGMAGARASINSTTDAANGMAGKMKAAGLLFGAALAGFSLGTIARENVEWVAWMGDHLARIPAMVHSIATTGDLEQYNQNFEMTAETTKRVEAATKDLADATGELVDSQEEGIDVTDRYTNSNLQLVKDIHTTETVIKQLEDSMLRMAIAGDTNSMAYEGLSNQLSTAKDRLLGLNLEAKQNNLGELLKSDLDLASAAFEALGLDTQEFATGLSSKTTASLSAFSEVAKLAGDDTAKLARAYNAASEQVGNNVQAQSMLQQQLLASTNGNSQLADEVKRVALEQKNAKSAADDQAAALSRLGISMDAVNQSMSASGLEMVTTLRNGITAIKEQATSADALKAALTQALDTSLAAAQTKADFDAISQTLKAAGLSGQVTAEQMAILRAGMQGGAEAVKAQTKALEDNALANTYSSNASNDNADAKNRQAEATDKAAAATANATQNESASLAFMQQVTGAIKNKIAALEGMSVTTEQTNAVWNNLMTSLGHFEGKKWLGIADFTRDMQRMDDVVKSQVSSFENAKSRADEMTQALSGSAVTSRDLSDAQHALRKATDASVQGIVRMDEQTLSNLQNAIDGARNRMQGLSDDAKNTADSLEATLAKLQGNEDKARDIEQTRKLTELEEKLNEAKKRSNAEEEAQLKRALDLQKQINREEDKKAKDAERNSNQPSQAQKSSPSSQLAPSSSKPVSIPTISNPLKAADVIDALDDRMIKHIKEVGAQEIIKQLTEEAKRRH